MMSHAPARAPLKESKADSVRARRVLLRAAIATVLYAAIVVIWPRIWREGLFYLGGVWSGVIAWENRGFWRLTIPKIHEQVKQRGLRTSVGEKMLALAAMCLAVYGFGGFL